MKEHGLESAKKPRLNSQGGGAGPQHVHRQQSDPSVHLQEQGGGARHLAPPNAYRAQAPHSPYQMQEAPVPQEHGGHEAFAQGQPPVPLPQRDLRSAPAVQTTFGKVGSRLTSTSPESAHGPRPLNPGFDGDVSHYGSHSASEVVDQSTMYPQQEGPPPGHYPNMMIGPPPYEHHHGPPPHGHYGEPDMAHGMHQGQHYPPVYGVGQPPSTWGRPQPPRRNVRASQACDTCRTRKVKCDEGKPRCSYCRENEQICVYKEVQPAKQDRAQKELMQAIAKQQIEFSSKFDHLNSKIDRVFKFLSSRPSQFEAESKQEPDDAAPEVATQAGQQLVDTSRGIEVMAPPTPVPVKRESINEGSGGSAQTIDHSVGVHRLFRWPTMQRMTSDPLVLSALRISKIADLGEDFILRLEQEKGMLRVYGVGQGQDHFDGALTMPTDVSTPPAMGEPIVKRSPAASPPDVWGTGLSAPNLVDEKYANGSDNDHPGGLNRDGSLRMDGDTMWSLFLSYMRNFHMLHPFLHELRLRRLLERVRVHMNPWEGQKSQFMTDPSTADLSKPSRKRRRSTDVEYPSESTRTPSNERPEPEHRISTVIVLLVMALGKMCQERQPLRGPVPENIGTRSSKHSSLTSHGSASPTFQTSPSQASSASVKSPALTPDNRLRLFGTESEHQRMVMASFRKLDKNVDVIPGLAYFAYATKILGALHGGSDLPFVQANLLASLYCGQHASSLQSWWYLNQACKICLDLMKGQPFTAEVRKDPARVQLKYFAYWTCYQLESDILAELDLEPSGIDGPQLNSEGTGIPYPNLGTDKIGPEALKPEESSKMIKYYHFQLHLRNTMNKIQPLLYPPDAHITPRRVEKLLEDRHNCRYSMQQWRDALLPEMRWDDRDEPSRDMLEARLRAKYYGAMYIINRPLLEYALHKMRKVIPPETQQSVANYRQFHRVQGAESIQLVQNEMEVYYACVDCIEAARQSTVAFDGIVFEGQVPSNRLIVTNIFGTAHAQFGNMLILGVTYKSHLNFMVKGPELYHLFDRTIALLDVLSPISKTLAQDRNILIAIRQNLERPLADIESATSSFSSS